MNIFYQGQLNKVGFTIAEGDLFDADVDAIVNSEESSFRLATSPSTVSGQIRYRYGAVVEEELLEQTGGEIYRAGSVIATSGGGEFEKIYHAGFHDPYDWPDGKGDSIGTDYFEAIGSCISQILDQCVEDGIESVAFPLLGCGVFGLDEKMLLLQFLDALERFDGRITEGKTLNAWLVIRDRDQFASITSYLMDMLFRLRSQTIQVDVVQTGVSMLDEFACRRG